MTNGEFIGVMPGGCHTALKGSRGLYYCSVPSADHQNRDHEYALTGADPGPFEFYAASLYGQPPSSDELQLMPELASRS